MSTPRGALEAAADSAPPPLAGPPQSLCYTAFSSQSLLRGIEIVKAPWLAGMLMALLCTPVWGAPASDAKEEPSAPLDPPPVTSPWRTFQFTGTLQQVREDL